jgi:hypothetical protein
LPTQQKTPSQLFDGADLLADRAIFIEIPGVSRARVSLQRDSPREAVADRKGHRPFDVRSLEVAERGADITLEFATGLGGRERDGARCIVPSEQRALRPAQDLHGFQVIRLDQLARGRR